ncbi:MAG TPA: TadE/TadG family type IV pilus assembly protein [Xanthobacteraceae bacterium]|jgi:Flp pilus assembly protein TadG|nr:TadE/TadG family type IV pilus assembly protein [Xanthobacteraceae bacterium]
MSGKLIAYLQRRGRSVCRFGRAHDGATAVEFALVAPALLATLIAILEISYFLFAQQTLQTAAVEAGRLFMTNQGPTQNNTVNGNGQLSSTSGICNIIKPLLSCGSVIVNVQSYQDYQSANTSMPSLYDSNCNAVTSWNYTAGSPGQVVVVQLIYPLTIVPGPLGFALSNVCNGKMQIMGVTAIRVEPS